LSSAEEITEKLILDDWIRVMLDKHGVYLNRMGPTRLRLVCHLHITREHLDFVVEQTYQYFVELASHGSGLG